MRKGGRGKHYVPRTVAPKPHQLSQAFATERARYANLENGFRDRSQRMFAALEAGDVELIPFVREFSQELYRYQVRMYMTGRRSVGRFDNALADEERAMLHGQHARQMKFFHAFMRDRAAGRGRMDYKRRLDMYSLSGYSIYLRGAVAAYGVKTKWHWRENPEAEHCEDCEERARLSEEQGGFTLEELEAMGFPGEGKTKCRTLCRCHLEPVEGRARLNRTRPTSYGQRFKKAA